MTAKWLEIAGETVGIDLLTDRLQTQHHRLQIVNGRLRLRKAIPPLVGYEMLLQQRCWYQEDLRHITLHTTLYMTSQHHAMSPTVDLMITI